MIKIILESLNTQIGEFKEIKAVSIILNIML